MDKMYKNWKEFYMQRSAQIYQLQYSKDIKKAEHKSISKQKQLLEFLKKKLSENDYEIVFNFINVISENNNHVTDLWNEKFYFSALKDAKKYEGVING